MNFPFYIAKRYLFSKKKHNAINIISGVSVCGVALATLALVCTLSVFNGFQDMVASFFTAFDPELKITVTEGKVFDFKNKNIQQLRAMPEVAVFTETLEESAMVRGSCRKFWPKRLRGMCRDMGCLCLRVESGRDWRLRWRAEPE